MTTTQLASAVMAISGTALLSWSDWKSHQFRRRIGKNLTQNAPDGLIWQLQSQLIKQLPNRDLIQAKLKLTGSAISVRQLRIQQFGYSALGAVLGLLLFARNYPDLNLIWLLLLPIFTAAGWLYPISNLNSKFQKLKDELNFGFPEVVDLIALSVTAGNSLNYALIQVSDLVMSPWRNQLIAIRLDLVSGLSVASSLERAAINLQHPTFTKFVSSVLLTLERGTPLSAQLRIQANEVSELLRRELMIKAGKKEAAMLLPVVFLILPTIVITTLFPGILALGQLI